MARALWGLEEIQSRNRSNLDQRFSHKNFIVAAAGWWFSTRLVVIFSLQKQHFIFLEEFLLLRKSLTKVTYFCLYQVGKWKAALQGSSLGVSVFLSEIETMKLARSVFSKLHEICCSWVKDFPLRRRPQLYYETSIHAIKNMRRKMEDKHVCIPDFNMLFNLEVKGPSQQSMKF